MKTRLALSSVGAVFVCALLSRGAGADPGTLVSFAWSSTGITDASALVGCNVVNPPPGCMVEVVCASNPAPMFSLGGSVLAFLQTADDASTNCSSHCTCCVPGGASGVSRVTGAPSIFDPVSSSDLTIWQFGGEIGVESAATAPPPDWCALGDASSDADAEQHWTLVFDVGAGPTKLSLTTDHAVQVIGPGIGASSAIRIRDAGDQTFYERTLTQTSEGGQVGSEVVEMLLPMGRYTLTIDSAASGAQQASSAGVNGAGGSALVDAYCGVTLSPYTCAVVAAPAPVMVCPGANAVMAIAPQGTGPHAYQWRKDGAPLADGDDYHGVHAPLMTVIDAHESDEGDYDCIVTDLCGATTTPSARLTVSLDGDYDDDGDVDFADLNRVLGGYNVIYTFADLNAVLSNYNSTC